MMTTESETENFFAKATQMHVKCYNVPYSVRLMLLMDGEGDLEEPAFQKSTFSEVYYGESSSCSNEKRQTLFYSRNATAYFAESRTNHDDELGVTILRAEFADSLRDRQLLCDVVMIRLCTRFHLDKNTVVDFNQFVYPSRNPKEKPIVFWDCSAMLASGFADDYEQIDGLGNERTCPVGRAMQFRLAENHFKFRHSVEPKFWPAFQMPDQHSSDSIWVR